MFDRLGVRWRLLFAFLGISAFAVMSAVAGTYAFHEVANVLEQITERRVPSSVAALELSRQADRIVAAAPALLTAESMTQHREVSAAAAKEVDSLENLLAQLRGGTVDSDALAEIEPMIAGFRHNLDALDELVARRLEASARKEALIRRWSDAAVTAQRLIAPGIVVMDAKVAAWRRNRTDQPAGVGSPSIGQLAEAIAENVPMQKAQLEFAALNDGLLKASTATSPADIPLVAIALNRSLSALKDATRDLDPHVQQRFEQLINEFVQLISGPESILDARSAELELITRAEALLAENANLSRRLTGAVDHLVSVTGRDIREDGKRALTAQRVGRGVLIGVVVMSLLSSVLIVWLYVERNLVARLTTLSKSMLAIAGGNLRAPLPSGGTDEIGRMAKALIVFRDTAVEVEEKNLRDVAEARQRLMDAIESITEGFALYDADDRLVLCNSRYREILYPGIADTMVPSTHFETIITETAQRGLVEDAKGRESDWIAERLAAHRNPSITLVQHRSEDRWIQVSERRISGGGTVAVYSDITELKRREANLAEKSTALEALSNKLAKYLAPQVYNSIFTGRQDVRIASQRKKLTVCFSDIAGFTETTDKLESEELTQLLNLYLTEMSKIALSHGATIDKYVGDAIVMFFGDPETRGVREDAIACVKMAIAMQKRIGELAVDWRNAGIESPLSCRIGIHTGFCTVGNFGSEDRMDYTIIGGAVNLASRLEHEATSGRVLISYETFAQVKDVIECEEQGQIHVKGIAYPITTYRVIDIKADTSTARRGMRAELPHLKLDVEPELMSDEERVKASAALRAALEGLAGTASKPG